MCLGYAFSLKQDLRKEYENWFTDHLLYSRVIVCVYPFSCYKLRLSVIEYASNVSPAEGIPPNCSYSENSNRRLRPYDFADRVRLDVHGPRSNFMAAERIVSNRSHAGFWSCYLLKAGEEYEYELPVAKSQPRRAHRTVSGTDWEKVPTQRCHE